MKIILSTGNPSKAEQIRAVFSGSDIEVLALQDVDISGDPVEDGSTLEDNAMIKARFAFDKAKEKMWTMADDTGIFIHALDGAPGVRSARWAGEYATTEEITRYTLRSMEGVVGRTAYFKTVVAVISPEGKSFMFDGMVSGRLLDAPRVPAQPKMPYSPLFVPDGSEKVWAEMSVEEENRFSHRGKAFRKVLEFLSSQK